MLQIPGQTSPSRVRRVIAWLTVLLIALSVAPIANAQDAEAQLKSRALSMMSGYESAPTAEEWRTLGLDGAKILVEIANDSAQSHTTRARAIAGLAYFPGGESEQTLRAILADAKSPRFFRRHAVTSLASVAGPAALETITPLLADEDVHLRESAARAVASIKTPQARVALELRLAAEPSEMMRELLQESIQTLPRQP